MTTDSPTDFICACSKYARSACKGEPFFNEHEGKRYCVLHYPSIEKIKPFRAALFRKLGALEFNFSQVWFPEDAIFITFRFEGEVRFDRATFNGEAKFSKGAFNAEVRFDSATFNAGVSFDSVTFNASARFYSATFNADADFNDATFGADADFHEATFGADANFIDATFSSHARFESATFNADAIFRRATFSASAVFDSARFSADARFNEAQFNDYTSFNGATFSRDVYFTRRKENSVLGPKGSRYLGENPRISFQFAHFEKPDRVSFHTLDLCPHWFINIDSRKFDFIDVEFGDRLKEELEATKHTTLRVSLGGRPKYRLLAIACRQLADNAEANHRYHEASRFRFSAFECRRLEKFWGFVPWRLDWWYWLVSGYGERVGRAFMIFVLLLGLFAIGYKSAEFEPPSKPDIPATPPPRNWSEAARYSINVALLQKPEPKPRGNWGWLVTAETILGPAQAALLALALRRRFMR